MQEKVSIILFGTDRNFRPSGHPLASRGTAETLKMEISVCTSQLGKIP